eukprot:CAMPEP_0202790268 /NCGR_PEP_ID=MMETSP1388-20130828/79057_1 /ASSEMBLY_ACC=CAM_ASM_000864 /TAXON_ID=37098 /ORGANISM="Isochrysis sp, Strain CCMP1244" /LENGTH=38 /DNA_ID= /DNA_START= /DNA_END= /DNA_ORIENTATION=
MSSTRGKRESVKLRHAPAVARRQDEAAHSKASRVAAAS